MRQVTLKQEIAAAVTLKQAKWEKTGGWKDPDPTDKLPSQLVKQVLEDIRKRRSPFFERNDPDKKLRDSIKRSGIHREITKKRAVAHPLPPNFRSDKLGGTSADDSRAKMAQHVVMKDIRNKTLEATATRRLMSDIRQKALEKKRMQTPPKFGDDDATNIEVADIVTVLFDQDFTVGSDILLDRDPPAVLEHLVNLENMVQCLTRQVDVLSAQMQALVQSSKCSKAEGKCTQAGLGIADGPSPTSDALLVNPMEEDQDDWVDVL